MAMKCFNCNKGIMYGHNVSHSKRRTPRTFKPNLHYARIKVNLPAGKAGGGNKRVRLCTKCLRLNRKTQISKLLSLQGSR